MSLRNRGRALGHPLNAFLQQRRTIFRPSFFETFRNAIATPAQQISTSAVRRDDGNHTYFQPDNNASPIHRSANFPPQQAPPAQFFVVRDERATGGAHYGGKGSRGRPWARTMFIFGSGFLLFPLFDAAFQWLYANGFVPFSDPDGVQGEGEGSRWPQKRLHRDGGPVKAPHSTTSPDALGVALGQTSASPPGLAAEPNSHAGALLQENRELNSELRLIKEREVNRALFREAHVINVRRLHRLLSDIITAAPGPQTASPGTSVTRPFVVRDDELLTHNPLIVGEAALRVPPSNASLVRIVDPHSGKNHALILGVDLGGMESRAFPGMEPMERDAHLGEDCLAYLHNLAEHMHLADENADVDVALYVWSIPMIGNHSMNSPSGAMATPVLPHNFPLGWPLKQLKAIREADELNEPAINNYSGPPCAALEFATLKNDAATRGQKEEREKEEGRKTD